MELSSKRCTVDNIKYPADVCKILTGCDKRFFLKTI